MSGAATIDQAAARAFATHLDPDEKLVWAARPDPSLYRKASGRIGNLIFGILFILFMVVLPVSLLISRFVLENLGAWALMCFILVPFPFYLIYWHHEASTRTYYGITTKRALALEPAFIISRPPTLVSIEKRNMNGLYLKELKDGFFDLIYYRETGEGSDGAFLAIRNGEQAQRLMHRYVWCKNPGEENTNPPLPKPILRAQKSDLFGS